MNFDLSEEQELFKSSVERFAAPMDGEARRALRKSESGYDRSRWQELAELGLIALAASEDQGGMGGSAMDLAVVAEALGKTIAPDPWLENGVLPTRLLAKAGASEALEGVLSGERIVAPALFERAARYDLMARQTKLFGGNVSGEKTFVQGGAIADAFIVSIDDGRGTSFYLIDADRDGVETRDYRLVDGSVGSELRLTNAAVSDEDKLDLTIDDLACVVADIRLLAGAEMLGLADRLLADTLAYVKEREQFGVPIGSFQALQHRLVECYAAAEQARSTLYRAAMGDPSCSADWQRSAAGAKAFIGEQADRVAREAVQMHGGMGVTDELMIGHALKRVLLLNSLFGDADATLVHYAEAA